MDYRNDTGLPSVTDVLSPWVDSQWFTDESKERGSEVHDACHAHVTGSYVIPLRQDWQGYFDSFRRWCDEADPVVEMAEKRLVNKKLGYCGQEDFIGRTRLRDGRGLIDWKTSLSLEPWYALQGAGYRDLARHNGLETEWGGNLRLKADGSMPLFDYWHDNNAANFSRFLCALTLWKYFKK